MTREKINVMLKYLRFTQICIVQDMTPAHYARIFNLFLHFNVYNCIYKQYINKITNVCTAYKEH